MPAGQKSRVLLVEDDANARHALSKLLVQEGFEVETAENGRVGLSRIDEVAPDVVLTDLVMPEMDGLELLTEARSRYPGLPVVLVTSTDDLSIAVKAMRQGAADYLTKPFELDALLVTLQRVLTYRNVRLEAENLKRHLREQSAAGLRGLLGTSSAMQNVYRTARRVSSARATVLITGESGTGKSELARAIHELGVRKDKPFVALHCAALAESLLESELFGHERGAFTGADKRRIGRFEQADGGTLFLDEIGEVPLQTQVKLLRVLQERVLERVGGNDPIHVDVRVVAATNRDLQADVRAGRFREDLYYRLNVVSVEMPPLRVRGSDALILAEHFLHRFALDNHRQISGFTDRAKTKILAHKWPGNVRALENSIERAVVLSEGEHIDAEDLPFESASESLQGLRIPGSTMAEVEKFAILKTLESVEGSTTRAAELLDISVRTIQYRLHEYGMAPAKNKGS